MIAKAEMLQTLQHNQLQETVVKFSREYDEKIRVLETNVDQVPCVWLEWRDEWLVGGMAALCRVCEGVSYVNRHKPACSGVDGGQGESGLYSAYGLSTDIHNSDVYVCDYMLGRIQVFNSQAIHQRTFYPQGLSNPIAIVVAHHQLFVSCELPEHLYKLDKLSGSILCSVVPVNIIHGLSADTDTLYAGMYDNNRICVLSLENLTTIRVTTLNSPHLTQGTVMEDLF